MVRHLSVRTLTAALLLTACDDSVSPGRTPTALRTESAASTSGVAGTLLATPPTFVITNASGQPIDGVAITVTVVEGGGQLAGAPTRTLAGPTPVGRWTLGTRAGRNVVEVRSGTLPPLQLVVDGRPGAPAALTAVSGSRVRVLAGTTGLEPLVLQVADRFGNGISGEVVRITLDSAGSTLTPQQLVSETDGRTPASTWQMGSRRRVNTGRATLVSDPTITLPLRAEFASDYQIELRFLREPTAEVRRIFDAAVDRIAGLLIGDVPDVFLSAFNPSQCGGASGSLTETVDDLVIYADVTPIDGVGRVLGRAGPCFVRTTSRHSIVGSMQFDEADAQNLINSGRFEAVVLHEMLHVVGIGSLWRSRGLLEGENTTDPRVTGARATLECVGVGFATACGVGTVPAENTGGSGTFGSHWRESVFDAELMTGFAEATAAMPLSLLTVGGLEDLGYVVNAAAVDLFAAPLAARFTFPRAPQAEEMDEVITPIAEVTPAGWVRRLPK